MKSSGIISLLRKFDCVSAVYFDAFYFICARNGITQDFYPNNKQDTRQRTALLDAPSQIKLLSRTLKFWKRCMNSVTFAASKFDSN